MASRNGSPTQFPLNPSPATSVRQSSPSSPSLRARLVPAPPATQPLSFSISRILGLEDDSAQSQSDTLLVCRSSNDQNRQNSDHSPSVDSDNPSTDVDSGRESDDAARSEPSSERPRKKKQRTTFSPIEVWELEKVFAQRPYLMPEDEDELVQKLGLTARNVRFWFQNRRAKSRRQERAPANIPQSIFPNQFDRSPHPAHAPSSNIQFWKQLYLPQAGFQGPLNFNPKHVIHSPRNLPTYIREETPCPCCAVQSNRLPAVEMDLAPNNAEYKPPQLRHLKLESEASLERLPSLPSSQFRKTSGERQRSRDYNPQGLMGIREYGE